MGACKGHADRGEDPGNSQSRGGEKKPPPPSLIRLTFDLLRWAWPGHGGAELRVSRGCIEEVVLLDVTFLLPFYYLFVYLFVGLFLSAIFRFLPFALFPSPFLSLYLVLCLLSLFSPCIWLCSLFLQFCLSLFFFQLFFSLSIYEQNTGDKKRGNEKRQRKG